MSVSRLPPHDAQAEAAVLSAALLDRSALDEVIAILPSPEVFFVDANRRIWEAILEVNKAGSAVDVVSVAGRLNATERLRQVGGSAYLAQISDATPAVAHVEDHARAVLERWTLRRVIDAARVVEAEAASGDVGEMGAWLQGVESRIYEATRASERKSTLSTFREAVESEHAAMLARKASKTALGIPTGFRALDKKIGGWMRGAKYTIAARPGMGKTGALVSTSIAAAKLGHAVVLISVEMPTDQLIQRAIAQESGVTTDRIGNPGSMTADEWSAVARAFKALAALPIVVDEAAAQTVASIRSAVRRGVSKLEKDRHRARLGLIGLDYLQLFTPSDKRGRSRENEVAEISNGTRQIAKEFDAAVLELSQLSRACEDRPDKRPTLRDLRESGAIEQDSFGVITLYREGYYQNPQQHSGECEILVRKVRQYGSCGTAPVYFNGPTTAFYDLAQEPDGYEDSFDNA